MRKMKREIGKNKKKKLKIVIAVAIIVAALSYFIVPDSIANWQGFIFYSIFIAIAGIGTYVIAKQPEDNSRY
jgi:uncharacterized membrane protein